MPASTSSRKLLPEPKPTKPIGEKSERRSPPPPPADKPDQSTSRRLSGSQIPDLTARLNADNYVKYPLSDRSHPPPPTEPPKVTFDLSGSNATTAAAGSKKARITEVPAAKRAVTIDRPAAATASQLPSDARQRLQELAGPDIKRNYRKASEQLHHTQQQQQLRPNRLNLGNGVSGKYIVSPPHSPSHDTNAALIKRTSLTRKDSRTGSQLNNTTNNSAKNSLIMNFQNNNVKKTVGGRVDSPGLRGGVRTRTPSVERGSLTPGGKESESSSKVRANKSFWGGWWKFS